MSFFCKQNYPRPEYLIVSLSNEHLWVNVNEYDWCWLNYIIKCQNSQEKSIKNIHRQLISVQINNKWLPDLSILTMDDVFSDELMTVIDCIKRKRLNRIIICDSTFFFYHSGGQRGIRTFITFVISHIQLLFLFMFVLIRLDTCHCIRFEDKVLEQPVAA